MLARVPSKSVIVALSGGKDSLACMDLCASTFERVEAFFMYLVPGLECAERPIKIVEKRYGIKVLRIPHWSLSHYLRYGLLRAPNYRAMLAPQITANDVETHVRSKLAADWIVYGHRMDESLQRRGMLHAIDGCWTKFRRIYPLWDWKSRDVFAYLKARKIALPGLTHGNLPSGFDLEPRSLLWMKQFAPDDYKRVLTAFPYAEARIAAWQVRQERKLKVRNDEKVERAVVRAKNKAAEKAVKAIERELLKKNGKSASKGS